MTEFEPALTITTYPRNGRDSASKLVQFGPVSDKFVFLIEVDPISGQIDTTLGNSPDTALLPKFVPQMLAELGAEYAAIEGTEQFQRIVDAED